MCIVSTGHRSCNREVESVPKAAESLIGDRHSSLKSGFCRGSRWGLVDLWNRPCPPDRFD